MSYEHLYAVMETHDFRLLIYEYLFQSKQHYVNQKCHVSELKNIRQ